MASIDITEITLNYVCDECDYRAEQPLTDIATAGTLICPTCDRDMRFHDYVSINAVAKIWVREDLVAHWSDTELRQDVTEEERERILDAAMNSRAWDALGDCTDNDWELVEMALAAGFDAEDIDPQ